MALVELLGSTLVTKDGDGETATLLQGKGAIALYFSAHWCPPCQRFTPMLAEWYSKSLKAKGLEVVFVSSDRDQGAFDEYYKSMPWLALPFDSDKKQSLDKKFKVQGIPTIILLDSDGSVLNKDGRGAISNDPTGEDFPWRQKNFGRAAVLGEGFERQRREQWSRFDGKSLCSLFQCTLVPAMSRFHARIG
jgi:nucleoredoxin